MSQNFIEEDPSLSQSAEKKKSGSNFSKKRVLYIITIVVVLVVCYFIIGFMFINKSIAKDAISPNSIAVLPFKDFSPENSQWFSDGVSDNILHSLAQMKNLSVISFTSSSSYRDTEKKIPEIAKELRVSYILEGSVTLVEGKIKIIAQLIDSNDNHVWSKEYNESFDDLISVQKNVAQEVMKELKITLSPQEENALEKYPTQNMEAYNLHLKGRLINDSRKVEDLKLNIELNKQAIALDSTFAEAYIEVALSSYLLARSNYIDPIENIKISVKYSDRAIKIDPSYSRAWMVKATLNEYKDWDKAKEYYEKTIALNPNDALAHVWFAGYLQFRPNPDPKGNLEHLTIAQQLDPFSVPVVWSYAHSLISYGDIEKAEAYFKKMKFLLDERLSTLALETRLVAKKNKDWTSVIPSLESKIQNNLTDARLYQALGKMYKGILNDDTKSIANFKVAYEIDSVNNESEIKTEFSNFTSTILYLTSLIEAKKFKDVKKIMDSKKIKSQLSDFDQKQLLWNYYYRKQDYDKAYEISKDSLLTNQYFIQGVTYAKLGDRNKVDSINKVFTWGDEKWRGQRAVIHAVLKDRDSMYFYLESEPYDRPTLVFTNGRSEFDPYRHEDRFKSFLKKWYLPVPGE